MYFHLTEFCLRISLIFHDTIAVLLEKGGIIVEWKEIVTQNFDSTLEVLERTLTGLTEEELNSQPKPDCNSISWTTWHITRALDHIISTINGQEQVWIRDGWYSKFNRPAAPEDDGYGHTPEQVSAFKCSNADMLLGYHRATLDKTRSYLAALSRSDLDRKIDDEWSQLFPTVGSRLSITIGEIQQHAGQVAYIRGLLQGHGWQGF